MMNTETKVHEYHLRTSNRACGQTAQEIYTRAYNAGKSDALKEYAERVKKSLEQYEDTDLIKKKYAIQILDKYLKEALGNED